MVTTVPTAAPDQHGGEVTGLTSAHAYAVGMTQALASAAAGTAVFAAGLTGHGIAGAAAAAVNRAHELTAQASLAWTAVMGALDQQVPVAQAYLSAPDAGGKDFLADSTTPPRQAGPIGGGEQGRVTQTAATQRHQSIRLIDLMCDRHRDLIVETRTWPPWFGRDFESRLFVRSRGPPARPGRQYRSPPSRAEPTRPPDAGPTWPTAADRRHRTPANTPSRARLNPPTATADARTPAVAAVWTSPQGPAKRAPDSERTRVSRQPAQGSEPEPGSSQVHR